ncbi:beta-lactamase/transpeptidase-like protein [Acephala macrosclerotiorum]|nr:beta-lactamase/transpeptidase-like protein [Acephala macrosclerotiorum]
MLRSFSLYLLHSLWISSTLATRTQLPFKHKRSPFDEKFNRLVNWTLDQWHVPGLSMAVIDGNDIWTDAWGYAHLPNVKATPETLYYGGSLTKAFTAAAMALLISSGNYTDLNWQTPISSLIRDDFVLADEWATAHVSLEDALAHRTGVPRHDWSYGGEYGDDLHEGKPRDVVRSLRDLPLAAEPRTTFHYCNIMYVVAGHVVSTLSGLSLKDFMRQRIWEPLGMKSTYFSRSDALRAPEGLAMGYVWHEDGQYYKPTVYMDVEIMTGASSIISTITDYAKWLRMFVTESSPLTPNDHLELKTPRNLLVQQPQGSPFNSFSLYALGWEIAFYNGYQVFQHTGNLEAFGCRAEFIPELNWAAVTCGNTPVTCVNAGIELIHYLLDNKIQLREEERFDWFTYHKESYQNRSVAYNSARDEYYPQTLDYRPLSLELARYAGTYYNPGYRNLTIYYKDGELQIDRNYSFHVHADLEHVTGDYFMAYMDSTSTPESVFQKAVAAEFVIGPDGVARKFGIAIETTMGTDGRIWFDRI